MLRLRAVWGAVFVAALAVGAQSGADGWTRREIKDKWGENTGKFSHTQYVETGTGHSSVYNSGQAWGCSLMWDEESDTLFVGAQVNSGDDWTSPVFVILDEKALISLRDSSGAVSEYKATVSAKHSNTLLTVVYCKNKKIIETLKNNRKYTILVEGGNNDSWRMKAEIAGGLPVK